MLAVSQYAKAKICCVSKFKKGCVAAKSQPQFEYFWRYDQAYLLGRPVRPVQMLRKKMVPNKPVFNSYSRIEGVKPLYQTNRTLSRITQSSNYAKTLMCNLTLVT